MAKSKKKNIAYRSPKIKIFDSIAEEQASNYKAIKRQDPAERIKETVKLILKVYGFTKKSLKARKSSNRIIFDS